MDIATIAGIIGGIAFIITGILLDGDVSTFYDLASIAIVLGGTIASTLIAYPLEAVIGLFRTIRNLFIRYEDDPNKIIDKLMELANIARREGLLALEESVRDEDDSFLQKGILLIVDGTDPELVKNILETELNFIEERHLKGQGIFKSMGGYAPAYGMIGTLIGLINMLKKLDEPQSIGPSMSVALVTTFYGTLLANLLFLPAAEKLRYKSDMEILYKEIILEGILSIQAGENPRIIEEKLKAFLSPRYRQIDAEDDSLLGGEEN
ncbi:MAG: motility protein A [Clostridiales bacterium]|nr:motility protein A [Clostridiales bacterium]